MDRPSYRDVRSHLKIEGTECLYAAFDFCFYAFIIVSSNFFQVGKYHLKGDGFHIQERFRHLQAQTIAAAIVDVDPFQAYGQ